MSHICVEMAVEDETRTEGDIADDGGLPLLEEHKLTSVQEEGVNTQYDGEPGHIGSYTGPEEEKSGSSGAQQGGDDVTTVQQAALLTGDEGPAGSQQGSRQASQQVSRASSQQNSSPESRQGSHVGLRPSSATKADAAASSSRPGSAQADAATQAVTADESEQVTAGGVQGAADSQIAGSRQASQKNSSVQRSNSSSRARPSSATSAQGTKLDKVEAAPMCSSAETPADQTEPATAPEAAAVAPQAPVDPTERPMTAATDASGGSSLRSTGLWTLGLGQAPPEPAVDATPDAARPPSAPMSVTEAILSSVGAADVLTELDAATKAEAAARDAVGKGSGNDAVDPAQYVIPDLTALDVHVDQGPGLPQRIITVYIDHSQQELKPYFGGYRSKRTSTAYHHACTQTPKAPKYAGAEPKLERQTQTVRIKTCSIQTVREASTQMERPGVVIDTALNVEKLSGKYQTSEERLAIVMAATQTIQRWLRGWMGRKRAAYLKAKKRERDAFLQEQEAKAQQSAEDHRRKEIERRMHPRTAADFEILYNELEAWRLQETRKIKDAQLPPDKEHELLQQLLHKETKLLQTIDRLKINANHENKDKRIQHTLGDMSRPKLYDLKNGKKVQVHTPFTTRAKELMQLYNGLNLPDLTIDERLDVLLHVKWTVKEFDCNLTREIVSLIDREADLLNRGRNPVMMEGLRKRISSMFLNFVETPEFNPEAARYQVVPMDFEQYMFDKLEKSSARPPVTLMSTNSKWDV